MSKETAEYPYRPPVVGMSGVEARLIEVDTTLGKTTKDIIGVVKSITRVRTLLVMLTLLSLVVGTFFGLVGYWVGYSMGPEMEALEENHTIYVDKRDKHLEKLNARAAEFSCAAFYNYGEQRN